MKKVLVATCVMAMTAFGITNASAEPIETAAAGAFGINLSLAGTELVDQTPQVTSVYPPGSSEEADVATIDAGSLALEGVGIQQAETSRESTIVPALVPDAGGGGTGDLLGGAGDLLGGFGLDDLLGGGDGVGDGSVNGVGGPDDNDIELSPVNARGFSSIDVTGVVIDEAAGGTGDSLGAGELGNIGDVLDLDNLLGGLGGTTGAAGTFQTQQVEDLLGGGVTGGELTEIVFEALLRLGVVESEAVAVCTGSEVRFDVASRLVDDAGSSLQIGDLLNDVITSVLDVTDTLAPDLIRTTQGEVVATADGVAINALHIVVGEGLGGGGGELVPTTLPALPVPTTLPITPTTVGAFQAQQVPQLPLPGGGGDDGGSDALIDIVLGHSEVSGAVCAAQAPPAPPAPPLVPTGPGDTLPVTGGGFGILPAVAALGLAGGAVAAGRLALRARREHTL